MRNVLPFFIADEATSICEVWHEAACVKSFFVLMVFNSVFFL